MGWTFLWLMLGLKIPIAALLYLVWWAIHQTPETADPALGEDGGARKPRHPRPGLPRHPRPRGAHGLPVPTPPRRVRAVSSGSLAIARAQQHARK